MESLQSDAPIKRRHFEPTVRNVRHFVMLAKDNDESADPLHGGLDMDQPYQRGHVWSEQKRREFVRSLMMGVPVPAIILNDRASARFRYPDGSDDWRYAVVDGKQRVTTLLMWHLGQLSIPASWVDPELIDETVSTEDGPYVTNKTLTPAGQRHFEHEFLMPVSTGTFPTLIDECFIYTAINDGVPMTEADLAVAHRMLREAREEARG